MVVGEWDRGKGEDRESLICGKCILINLASGATSNVIEHKAREVLVGHRYSSRACYRPVVGPPIENSACRGK